MSTTKLLKMNQSMICHMALRAVPFGRPEDQQRAQELRKVRNIAHPVRRLLSRRTTARDRQEGCHLAVNVVQGHAVNEGLHGVLVARHGPGSFTVAIRNKVAFGLTLKKDDWVKQPTDKRSLDRTRAAGPHGISISRPRYFPYGQILSPRE